MCRLCAITTRYPRSRQESQVFNLSQFAVAVTASPVTQQSQTRQPQTQSRQTIQEKIS
jgi:hypothetical protein